MAGRRPAPVAASRALPAQSATCCLTTSPRSTTSVGCRRAYVEALLVRAAAAATRCSRLRSLPPPLLQAHWHAAPLLSTSRK